MPYEDERRTDLCSVEELVEFANDLFGITRCWSQLTPSESCAVIGHCPSILGNFCLDVVPTQNSGHQAGFKNHGGAALAHREQVQALPLQIHQAARRRIALAASSGSYLLENPNGKT